MREQMDDACMDPYVPDGTATYLDAPTVPLRKTFDGNVQDMYIAPDAMARVRRGGRLNDEVLYAGLVTFIAEDPVYSSRIATFHPFQYTNWSDGAAPRKLMRAVRRTAFHMKEVVLVPVFDREHWMLAAAHPRTGTIEFYDSLAIASWWRDHAKVRVGPAAPSPLLISPQRVAGLVHALLLEVQKDAVLPYEVPRTWTCVPVLVRMVCALARD